MVLVVSKMQEPRNESSAQTEQEPLSLWACLHDAKLENVTSDLLDRSARLTFDSAHIRNFHGFPSDWRFVFIVSHVSSVAVMRWIIWPGGPPVVTGLPWIEQELLRNEYQQKGRSESRAWEEFETDVSEEPLDVMHADLQDGATGLMLNIQGTLNGEWHEVKIVGSALSVRSNGGDDISLNAIISMGEKYWDAFGD